jgi:hypothetical protein
MKKILIFLFFISCLTPYSQGLQKIKLSESDAYANQHGKDDFAKLIDGDIETRFTVWSPRIIPYQITFPFYDYDNVAIKQLKFRINNGNPSALKFYYVRKDDNQKVLIGSFAGGNWDPAWRIINCSAVNAKSFIIESSGGGDFPEDIELWGDYKSFTLKKSVKQPSSLNNLFGAVVKPWDIASDFIFPEKIPSLKALGLNRVRLYNDYEMNHDASGNLFENHSSWHQSTNMTLLKSKGISTQMCYQALPKNYPWPPSGDKYDPASYRKLAQDVFWFGTKNKSGGEYFRVFELLNEQNCWYCPDTSLYFDGYALAAMCSMAYDGHKGKYPGIGLKASGTAAQFSIGGLAEAEPYILHQIMEWSEKNRGYRDDGTIDLPFDIYSFHVYSSLEGQRQGIPGGVAPEFGALQYLKKTQKIRDRFFPWLRLHVGEWGWDINPESDLSAPAFGKYSAHQTSAMWTVRELLWMAATGIDASSYFRIKQDYDASSDADNRPFATMALLRQHSDGVKQIDGSYSGMDIRRTLTGDYFKQLSDLLGEGYVFDSIVATSPTVLRFKKGITELYALWQTETMIVGKRPMFTERKMTYKFGKSGTLKRLVDDSSGKMSSQVYTSNTLLTIDAKPIFVILN